MDLLCVSGGGGEEEMRRKKREYLVCSFSVVFVLPAGTVTSLEETVRGGRRMVVAVGLSNPDPDTAL